MVDYEASHQESNYRGTLWGGTVLGKMCKSSQPPVGFFFFFFLSKTSDSIQYERVATERCSVPDKVQPAPHPPQNVGTWTLTKMSTSDARPCSAQ